MGSDRGTGYSFTEDPREIFAQFFGRGTNPFDEFMEVGPSGMSNGYKFLPTMGGLGGLGGFKLRSGSQSTHKHQDAPVEYKLSLSLEELYSGCSKKMKISRQVVTPYHDITREDKVVVVDVKPGWKAGTKITFPKEGDQAIGKIPSDVIFVVGEKQHQHFERDGNNLIHKAKVTLKNALCGGYTIALPLIEGGSIKKTLDGVIHPGTIDIIRGHGMPISKQPGVRGDMLVSYDIIFPTNFTEKDKNKLGSILSFYQ